MKSFSMLLMVIILIAICTIACASEKYPYPVKEENGCIFPGLLNYFEKSTADAELLEISSDGKSWIVDFDKQRKPFRVIGICSYPEGTFEELNERAKAKTYVPRFTSDSTEPYVKGLEVHSHHFAKNGEEVFIPFHYLVYPNGNEIEVFSDPLIGYSENWRINQVPWAMGNWSINCESIVIAALGDGNLTPPQVKTINKRISLLRNYQNNAEIKSRLSESQTKLLG
ncbi:MAG: hypothetical protein PHR47_00670 [Candidatus Pacebacteria bacterium]|nr:hypothetical protein [Candidatus Paceibacterota bacterium]